MNLPQWTGASTHSTKAEAGVMFATVTHTQVNGGFACPRCCATCGSKFDQCISAWFMCSLVPTIACWLQPGVPDPSPGFTAFFA
eukprot:4534440-Amphidinium_carterae.1